VFNWNFFGEAEENLVGEEVKFIFVVDDKVTVCLCIGERLYLAPLAFSEIILPPPLLIAVETLFTLFLPFSSSPS